MTTTLIPPDSAATMRILPIAANLLPPEIVESRQGRQIRYVVLGAVAAVVVVLGGWYALSVFQTANARDNLATAQAEAQSLRAQQQAKTYRELVTTQARSAALESELRVLMAKDLPWSTLLAALQSAAPGGVRVTGVDGSIAGPAGGVTNAQLPGLASTGLVGTLTISGDAPTKAVIAAYLDALAKVPGLTNPLVSSVNASTTGSTLHFTLLLDIAASRLGGRFGSPAPVPSVVTR